MTPVQSGQEHSNGISALQNRPGYDPQAAFDLTQSVICNLDGRVSYWSRGAVEVFGWTEKEAVGQICHELLKADLPVPEAEIRRELLLKGRWRGKYQVKRRDGQQLYVAAHWVTYVDGPGAPVRVIRTYVELPVQNAVDDVDHLADGLLIMDSQFRITYLNFEAERLLKENRDALIGKSVWDAYPIIKGTRVHQEYTRAMRERLRVGFEYFYEPSQSWFHICAFPERGGGLSVTFRDITEEMKAEESRRASEMALRTLTAGLFNSHDAERRGISNELHDRLNQELAALQLDLSLLTSLSHLENDILDQIHSVSRRVAELSDGLTRIASQLHPSILDHLGLEVAMRAYTTEFAAREKLRCRFLTRNAPASLSPEMGICFYRILQEALENVARHGNTGRVVVHLSSEANEVFLSVRDYGKGFDVDAQRGSGGLGLIHMEERMRLIHGSLTVRSRPGHGTVIEARAPLFVERRKKAAVTHKAAVAR
jgi:PAS domain S-box-containing protein